MEEEGEVRLLPLCVRTLSTGGRQNQKGLSWLGDITERGVALEWGIRSLRNLKVGELCLSNKSTEKVKNWLGKLVHTCHWEDVAMS